MGEGLNKIQLRSNGDGSDTLLASAVHQNGLRRLIPDAEEKYLLGQIQKPDKICASKSAGYSDQGRNKETAGILSMQMDSHCWVRHLSGIPLNFA